MKMNLQEKLEKRLRGAKFRLINEKIYKNKISKLYKNEMKEYHIGYADQVKKWPENPLDVLISKLKCLKNKKIADLGCGEAKLSKELTQNTVFSVDLLTKGPHIIEADIEKTPFENDSMDIVVFCLSLMKKNVFKAIKESNRICKKDGILYIAEVASRFSNIKKFIEKIEKIGYRLKFVDKSNNHFVLFEFEKTKDFDLKGSLEIILKPCKIKPR
ncbi:hypothetical protein EDEG_03324, partial [Edhazardia aedis USNM 41457]